eukprot:CAMPEP_0204829422 /NCGR_PEP_ID=MMETSP1346-20131115/7575_1 /ASSEMBLY_ACC=CAM_ASM_000771 /TAXON_ID=215587 /ORGANISM="Aplanochytrium stocchinoi, Strain GSBS06" /LENGTH=511 /DNA_ID=CAMNT_0051959189 /DNA_START=47 /DNA_END=1582 /DNA_ORIENTATION=+
MVFGNIYYSWMGVRLAAKEGRDDVTALPYGVNTPAAFAFVFSIIGPVVGDVGCDFQFDLPLVNQSDADAFAACWKGAIEKGWQVGVVSNLLVGIISVLLGLFGDFVIRFTPTATLLTSLAGIGIAFLGLSQATLIFANPVVGILPLYLVVIGYFADINFAGPVPISLAIILVSIILGAADDVVNKDALSAAAEDVAAYGLSFAGDALGDWSEVSIYIGTIFPVALAAAAGTLMNVISAKKAGDSYPLKETMISDGFGTMIGAFFGTPFGTSVYIGHPAYKRFGAGIGYSLINCVVFFFFAIFGIFAVAAALVPPQGTAPLLIYVGFMICKEALEEMPNRQYPTFIIGILPALSDFASTLIGTGIPNIGLQALAKSSILLALVQSTIWWYIIERHLAQATAWTLAAAILAGLGVIHQPAASGENFNKQQVLIQDFSDPANSLFQTEQWRFMVGYLLVIVPLAILAALQKYTDKVDPPREPYVPTYEKDENVVVSHAGIDASDADIALKEASL